MAVRESWAATLLALVVACEEGPVSVHGDPAPVAEARPAPAPQDMPGTPVPPPAPPAAEAPSSATAAAHDASSPFASCPERLRSLEAVIPDIPPARVLAFVRDVQQAIGRRDAAAVARVAHFPVLVLEEPQGESRVRSARELAHRFDEIFDPAVSSRLASADPCSLQAVWDEGVYYGRTLTFSERRPGRLQLEEIWRREAN